MNVFDILIAYVTWSGGGKKRPVLVLEQGADDVTVFKITTRFEGKNEIIRSKYFKINDWRDAGLDRQSYIDTNSTVTLPLSSVDLAHPVGKLTEPDVRKFIEFLTNEK